MNAFLNAPLEETLYMEMPHGYAKKGYICLLLRPSTAFISLLGNSIRLSPRCYCGWASELLKQTTRSLSTRITTLLLSYILTISCYLERINNSSSLLRDNYTASSI